MGGRKGEEREGKGEGRKREGREWRGEGRERAGGGGGKQRGKGEEEEEGEEGKEDENGITMYMQRIISSTQSDFKLHSRPTRQWYNFVTCHKGWEGSRGLRFSTCALSPLS